MKNENREKFDKLVSNKQSGWLEDARWREENQDWLEKSARIAVTVLGEIRRQKPVNGMSQKKLAEEMGVSPQYVNKIVKGQENLSLQTIAKIENVLGVKIIEVGEAEDTELQHAIGVLIKYLRKDPDYRQGWKANIAMATFDEFKDSGWNESSEDVDLHAACNRSADRFLQNLCA